MIAHVHLLRKSKRLESKKAMKEAKFQEKVETAKADQDSKNEVAHVDAHSVHIKCLMIINYQGTLIISMVKVAQVKPQCKHHKEPYILKTLKIEGIKPQLLSTCNKYVKPHSKTLTLILLKIKMSNQTAHSSQFRSRISRFQCIKTTLIKKRSIQVCNIY